MPEIRLPGDNRAVDGKGYWIRAWHAVLESLTRNLSSAETTIAEHTSQIAAINTALAENDIEVTPPAEETPEEPTEEPEPEPEPEPEEEGWQIAVKVANTERPDMNGYFDDPDLQFPVGADETWAFRMVIGWQTSNNATIQWRLAGPTTFPSLLYQMRDLSDNGSQVESVRNTFNVTRSRGSDQARGVIEIDGMLSNGSEGGAIIFQWGQDSADTDITRVVAGSYVEYRRIA